MPRLALQCSHEQIPPSRLPQAARRAEEAGVDGANSCGHLSPWSARQGESGFASHHVGADFDPLIVVLGEHVLAAVR